MAHRFVLWFAAVAWLPLALLGYLSLRSAEATVREMALAAMSSLADKKATQIQLHVAETVREAELFAHGSQAAVALTALRESYEAQADDRAGHIRRAQAFDDTFSWYFGPGNDSSFHDAFLITPRGDVVYTYKRESDLATNLFTGPWKSTPLAASFRESCATLEPRVSELAHYAPSNEHALFVSAPVVRKGELLGVVAFQLNSAKVNEVAADSIGLGLSGRTSIGLSTPGGGALLVAPLRKGASRRDVEVFRAGAPMQKAVSGENGRGMMASVDGAVVLAAWRYLPQTRWGMVIEMDAEEAFAPLAHNRRELLGAMLMLGLLGGAVLFRVGRGLVARIGGFVEGADAVARGDLGRRLEESAGDEIGAAGGAFNAMAERLQATYRNLERRVEQRTRELSDANAKLQREVDVRARSEAALARRNDEIEKQRKLLDEAQALGKLGSWELNLVTGELQWSDEIYRIFEIDPATFVPSYEAFLSVLHPADRDQVNRAYTLSLEDRQPYDVVHRLLLAGGRVKWVREHCTSEFDASGKALRSIGAVQDITEQKRAEEELRIAAAAFETHEAIMITDAEANILRVNRAFEETTGYSAEEVVGQNPRILSSGRQQRSFYEAMWQELAQKGSWTGEMWDRRKSGQVYPKWLTVSAVKDHRGETSAYVAVFSDITARKQAEEEIQHLAFYDALTRLPNRRLLLDRFRQALSLSARSQTAGAILFLDLDRFKMLNDTLGHQRGDVLLVQVGERITACVREVDTVARLGGDEFIVLLENIGSDLEEASRRAAAVAERIRVALAEPYLLDGAVHHTSSSIGVSLFQGDSESVDSLIKQADMAMYQSKAAGRHTVRFFDPNMQRVLEERTRIEMDLHHAIPNRELRLFYQIQVDRDGQPLGAEALVRWHHPGRGLVSPAQFIPIAEESSLIVDVGNWVLQEGCRQLALWGRKPATRELALAVNVSAAQLRQADFVEGVARELRRHGADPRRLKLELTETVVMSDVSEAVRKMDALRQLGVKLSMDDFGTGYSSLSNLKRLPLDQLKIDQSFVRELDINSVDAVMVRAIIDIARTFDLEVVAEGVETEEQRRFLEHHGCRLFQGYLFGKPLPIETFETLLDAMQPPAARERGATMARGTSSMA